MVITMSLKHVIIRGKTYFFRLRIPRDCIEQLGRKEVTQSLTRLSQLGAQLPENTHFLPSRHYKEKKMKNTNDLQRFSILRK